MSYSLNINAIEAIEEFKNYCLSIGLLISEVIADGRNHRCKTLEDKQGQKSGVYKLFLDGWPAGFATNYRYPDNGGRWKLPFKTGRQYSAPNMVEINRKLAQRQKEQEALYKRKAQEAIQLLKRLPSNSSKKTYLDRKQVIAVPGIKFREDTIYVPYGDVDFNLTTYQTISYSGEKRFFANAKKHGSFFQFMRLPKDYSSLIFVGEGLATMLSVYMSTGCPVAVAGDVGNIQPVVEALKARYQNARIIICADNDGPGLKRAEEWKEKLGVTVKFPPQEGTDFNDLHVQSGLEAIINVFKGSNHA